MPMSLVQASRDDMDSHSRSDKVDGLGEGPGDPLMADVVRYTAVVQAVYCVGLVHCL